MTDRPSNADTARHAVKLANKYGPPVSRPPNDPAPKVAKVGPDERFRVEYGPYQPRKRWSVVSISDGNILVFRAILGPRWEKDDGDINVTDETLIRSRSVEDRMSWVKPFMEIS